MLFINHRINTLAQLKHLPLENGVELDIRYHENELVLHHDPLHHHETQPEKFENFLKAWQQQGIMVLNIKTEGIEQHCIDLMNKFKIKQWFFLDLSMPYFVLYANKAVAGTLTGFGPENLAVRFSEYEPIEYALAFKNKAAWVWVDCFNELALNTKNYQQLTAANFKICLVSPELQKHNLGKITDFKEQLSDKKITAVCTKRPDLWGQTLDTATLSYLKEHYPEN